ncbi:MAG: sigma-70 family RNA polymerase sigma factor [Caldilineaceae bacterium]|nr:sigma-70 family RNA polymerase sigma factor [Caldilineaceae bacterium]
MDRDQRATMAQVREFQDSADDVLLRRIAEQDVAAYEEFYRRYAAQAYGVIVRIVHERAVADELLQEVFWQVWRSAAQYRGGNGAAWLMQIARNRSLDQLRRRQARPALQDAPDRVVEELAGRDETTPDALFELAARRAHVKSALAQIPPEQRVCIELAYFEGLTHQQIATQTGVAAGTIKSRLRLGLEKLEHLLRGQGYP